MRIYLQDLARVCAKHLLQNEVAVPEAAEQSGAVPEDAGGLANGLEPKPASWFGLFRPGMIWIDVVSFCLISQLVGTSNVSMKCHGFYILFKWMLSGAHIKLCSTSNLGAVVAAECASDWKLSLKEMYFVACGVVNTKL